MTIALIAFDGSENAMRAIDKALDTLGTSKLHEEEGLAVLTPAKARLESAGIAFDAHVCSGNPAEVITDSARKYHCNLIVMGTRGMGTIKNLLLGSVAAKVVHLTEKPLLLVK